jgi:signal transduction histidine kinase/ActR/RegA family two-component response regulator
LAGIVKKTIDFLFSEKLPIEAKKLNIVLFAGMIGAIVSLVTRYFMGSPLELLLALAGIIFAIAVSFYVSRRFQAYFICTLITVVFISYILLPLAFFYLGGIFNSAACYFILGTVIIFLLIQGRSLFIFLGIHIVLVCICHYINSMYSDIVYKLGGSADYLERIKYIDSIQTILVVGICIGAIILFQNKISNDEIRKTEAANSAKSNFLSSMSHEMRTPINAIIGMTLIGKKSDDMHGKNNALNKIGDASSHLLGVISDILDMAKIEANRLELAPIEFNFEKMLHKVLAVVNFRINEKKQKLVVNIDKEIPDFLVGDDQRLAQVITNLLSNAVKFTPEDGKIQLNASLLCETDEYCELRIEITDNGIGIASEHHKKLFSMFEQAESGTSRKYGGTGLGLVISKNIVELMNGKIWVESELGKGTRFSFTIKAGRSTKKSHAPFSLKELQDQFKDIDEFTGKKMLLAEDIDINREILISLLEDTGIIIDCAENGQEALDMVEADPNKYDIIFMDMQMPKMDGLEATRLIRALPSCRLENLPIVAMTANVFKDDIDACIASGMNDHLGKPLDMERVMEVLRKYLYYKG